MNPPENTASDPSDISYGISDTDRDALTESEVDTGVTKDSVSKMLFKAVVRSPSAYPEVNLSLSRVSQKNATEVLNTAMIFLETNFALRPQDRLLIYESLADSVIPYVDLEHETIPVSRARAFMLRIVADIEKLSAVETDLDRASVPVAKMANVLSSVAMLSFGDLALDVLLTSEFVYGKPTIQNVTVQEALIDIFKNKVTADLLVPNLYAIMLKLANVPSFAINYPVISAIARGINRCFSVIPENSQALFPIILDTVLASSGGEISTDSLESILLLVSLVGESAPDLPIMPQLAQAVLTVGDKGLQTDDLREIFLASMEIIWTRNVPLYETQTNLFELVLAINQVESESLKIWQLSPGDDATNFLCHTASQFGTTNEIRNGETAILALIQVAIARKETLSNRVFDLIESVILTSQEKSFPISPRGLISILDLLTEIDAGLLYQHSLIIRFLLRMVLNPSAIISEKFPNGFPSADLTQLRQAGARALVSLCARVRDAIDDDDHAPVIDLLSQLLESIEHMPSRGVGIICRCVGSLLSSGEFVDQLEIPESQAIVVVLWMLVSMHVVHSEIDPEDFYSDDLTEDIATGYAVISDLMGCNRGENELFSTEKISTQFAKFIDTYPTENREIFLSNCLDAVVSILSAPITVPRIRVLLIQVWSVIVREIPTSLLTTVNQLLDLQEVITCSIECIETTGKILGELIVEQSDSAALLECFRERFEAARSQIEQCSGSESFLLNTIRLSKKSLRGLFASDATEQKIKTNIRIREILVIVFGLAGENEWITETLLDELEREHDAIIASSTVITSAPVFETTIIILDSLSTYLVKTTHSEDIVFSIESCVEMLKAVGGSSPLAGSLLTCLASLLATQSNSSPNQPIEISPELFSDVLEQTLQAIVETVPDNALLLNSLSTESKLLTERCNEAALVMKSLFHQTGLSWVGLNRLTKAIYALGGGGALPLIRWVCVRIISIVIDDGGLVETDQDVHELLDIIAVLVGRLDDSYSPVRLEANRAIHNLFMRWKITSDESRGEEITSLTSAALASVLTKKIPVQFVSSFLLGLISNVHDLDSEAASGTVKTIHCLLESRSGEIFEDENSAADAVVDAITIHASAFPSPPSPPSHWPEIQSRLVGTLRFIAAVRFHIAIKDLLTPLDDKSVNFSVDKVHAIRSFILDKKTLAFFVKELIVRLNTSDNGCSRTACIAFGHLLDCYTDSSVSNVATKNFAELYCSLLVHLWFRQDTGDEVRVVIQKLMRAAGNAAVGDSVTTESGLVIFRNSHKILESSAKFLAPFLTGKAKLVPHTILVSQLVGVTSGIDLMFLELFENFCEINVTGSSVEMVHSLRGLQRIVDRWVADRDSLEDTDSHVMRMLNFLNNLIVSNDEQVCHEALLTIGKCLHMAVGEVREYLIHPILGQLRRVVDHPSESVRIAAFDLISGICDLVDHDDENDASVVEFYRSVSDLWIPCVVRTQEPTSEIIRRSALSAFTSILNNAVREKPLEESFVHVDPLKHYQRILEVVKTEIGECSFVHLNACCYYFLGLASVSREVRIAAARLVPVILAMIPEPSAEATTSVVVVLNSMLASGLEGVFDVVANILIEAKRIQGSEGAVSFDSSQNVVVM